jgi:ribosomal protein S18 acetylase RimI-like enzyme
MGEALSLRRFEEAGFNAWPALQTNLLDGWVLRFADGYTKRANSVNPTYPSDGRDLADHVSRCEAIYRERDLPPIFRLTSFGCPAGLDELLAARAYHRIDPTEVMSRSLTTPLPEPRAVGTIAELPRDAWLEHYVAFTGATIFRQATHAAMLGQIGARARFCVFTPEVSTSPVACGLLVLDGELAGLFDIATAREQRNHGYGGALVGGMLALAVASGAGTAYLQVMTANEPACRLYRALGFTTAYSYWYRVSGS